MRANKQLTSTGIRRRLPVCLFLAVLVLVLSPVDLAGLGSPAVFAQDLSSSQGAEEVVHGPAPKLSAADYPQIAGA